MGYSQIVYNSMVLGDITPPGAPVLVLARTGANEIEARVTLPTTDSDGSALTGMEELIIALVLEQTVGQNPFDGVEAASLASFAEGLSGFSSTIFLNDADAGLTKTNRFGTLITGGTYWVAAVVKDSSTSIA